MSKNTLPFFSVWDHYANLSSVFRPKSCHFSAASQHNFGNWIITNTLCILDSFLDYLKDYCIIGFQGDQTIVFWIILYFVDCFYGYNISSIKCAVYLLYICLQYSGLEDLIG